MIKLILRALDKGLEMNQHMADAAANGFDWLFRSEQLVHYGETKFELVYQGDPMSVLYYNLAGESAIELADGGSMPVQRRKHAIPLVLIPPLGIISETFDLMPDRSLVRFMAARGFHTYLISWGRPGRRHARLGMKDYADRMMSEAIEAIRRHSGSHEVSLMGWCMGGLISLLHAGFKRNSGIRNIVTVASPIDMRGGGLAMKVEHALNPPARLIRRYTSFRLHALDPESLQPPWWATTLLFKMLDPVRSVTTYWDLLMHLSDRDFVESYTTTSAYLNRMLAYPGSVIQDMLVHVVVDNKLAKGEVKLGKRISRFSNIHASMLIFAGERDVLVPVSTAQGIMELVSSKDKQFEVADGGHMGVMLGRPAQRAVWARSADWLAQRSGRDSAKTTIVPVPAATRPATRQKTRPAANETGQVKAVVSARKATKPVSTPESNIVRKTGTVAKLKSVRSRTKTP